MNLLPRFLAVGLILLLAVLAAMLALPGRYGNSVASRSPSPVAIAAGNARPPAVSQMAVLAQRIAFPIAMTGVAFAIALLASLSFRNVRAAEPPVPTTTTRAEFGALAKLAETSVVQGQELAHERSVRQRAQEDANLNQQLFKDSLEEKIRLGRDLHDGIIQSLYAAGLTIEAARAVAKTDAEEADRRLAQCLQNLNQTIRDVRTYIVGLAPENLREAGFAQALDAMVAELNAGRDVSYEFKIDEIATRQLSPEQSIEALQIAREAISNSLRHGKASRVAVRLQPGMGEVCLLVQDNGQGFDKGRRSSGLGLNNMQARATRLGATVQVESTVGKGTRVVLTMPVGTS